MRAEYHKYDIIGLQRNAEEPGKL